MSHRFATCAGLFAVTALLVVNRPGAVAQNPKDKKDNTATLEKQLKAALQDIAQGEKLVAGLKQDIAQLKAQNNKLEAQNNQLQAALKKEMNDGDDKTIKALQTTIDGYRGAGLVHVVVLKAKSDTKAADVASLIEESYSQLTKIKGVRGLWAGKPAAKATPEAATDYTVALALLFDDAAGVRAYLNDPIHVKFADKHLKKWETPVVHDFEPRKARP